MARCFIRRSLCAAACITLASLVMTSQAEAQTDAGEATGDATVIEVGGKFPLQSQLHVRPREHLDLHFGGFLQYLALAGRSPLIASVLYRSPAPDALTVRIGPTVMLFDDANGRRLGVGSVGIGGTLGVDYPIGDRFEAFADLSISTRSGGTGGVHFPNTGIGLVYRLAR